MINMILQSIVAIIVLPVPIVHLWLHALLPFWRKSPWKFYFFCGFVWTAAVFLISQIARISIFLFEPVYALEFFGYLLIVLGFLAAASSVFTLGYKRFFVWAVLRPESVKQEKIKAGPFKFIPHPAYIGYIFVAVGNFLGSGALYLLPVCMLMLILTPIIIFLEEEEMRKRFN